MRPTIVRHLSVRGLRNLQAVDLEPAETVNVVYGDNGQGKTSLLEAIYLVATTRSFRTHRVKEAVSHGADACHVLARLDDGVSHRTQTIAISASQQLVRVDGQKPENLAAYAIRTPVVVFHPGELSLTMGTAAVRRTLMDRVALFLDPSSLAAHRAYTRAMKERQKALEREGTRARAVDPWEQLLAEHGARLTAARRVACEKIDRHAREAFQLMGPDGLLMTARYVPAGSEDIAECRRRLLEDREKDLKRPTARFGPHRDDLGISLGGRAARVVASQGQHRLMTLSLKVAELACLSDGSGTRAVLLLDDVSSELDASRATAFFSLLGTRLDQVFLTTARREVALGVEQSLGSATLFEVVGGQVRPRL